MNEPHQQQHLALPKQKELAAECRVNIATEPNVMPSYHTMTASIVPSGQLPQKCKPYCVLQLCTSTQDHKGSIPIPQQQNTNPLLEERSQSEPVCCSALPLAAAPSLHTPCRSATGTVAQPTAHHDVPALKRIVLKCCTVHRPQVADKPETSLQPGLLCLLVPGC